MGTELIPFNIFLLLLLLFSKTQKHKLTPSVSGPLLYVLPQGRDTAPDLSVQVCESGLKTFSQPPDEYLQPRDSSTRVRSVPYAMMKQ